MKTVICEEKENFKTLEIEIEPDKIKEAWDKILKKSAQSIVIKGFRKGKAPLKMVENYIEKDHLSREIYNELIPKYYEEAIYENELTPIGFPNFPEIGEIEKEKPLIFKATFEVKPQIEIKEYKNFEFEQEKREITDKDVEQTLINLQKRAAKLVNVEEERGIQEGDYAIIDFESYFEGEKQPLKTLRGSLIQVKREEKIEQSVKLMESLLGLKKGEIREIEEEIPQQNKKIKFKVTLYEIKKEILPDLDDAFVKEISQNRFQTMEELKGEIRKDLEEIESETRKAQIENKIFERIFASLEYSPSQSMVDYETNYIISDLEKQLHERGLSMENYLKHRKIDEAALKNEYKERAEKLAKIELVIDAVARQENLNITPQEVDDKIAEFAQKTNQDKEKIKSNMDKEKSLLHYKYNLLKQKAMDFLIENSKITYIKPEEGGN
ncbi:MAG: trigger factor [Armatimonadetes bacterium]|nr:trigger factor [Armatimonadota bacterium]